MRVTVVGAGVVGLSAAVRLREAGFDAHIVASEMPPETTSAVAAAMWYPYRAFPAESVTRWGARSYQVFAELAESEPAAAITIRWGHELHRERMPDPWWREAVADFSRVPAADLPPGYLDGWRFPSPIVDTSRYLPWLANRLAGLGGTLTRRRLDDLDEAFDTGAGVVINCAGLGARKLAGDAAVLAVRGQVVYLGQVGITEWLLDHGDESRMAYVIPRTADIVCGGTAEEAVEDPTPDPETAAAILRRCRTVVPELAGAPVLGHRVGLRPGRPQVRLETERWPTGPVVHCYGHGGAGITLSWGCAEEITAAVRTLAG